MPARGAYFHDLRQGQGKPGIVSRDGRDNSLRLHDSAQVEVSNLDSPVLVHQQIGGFKISVQNGWLVRMQLQHALQKAPNVSSYAGPSLCDRSVERQVKTQAIHNTKLDSDETSGPFQP